MHTLSRRYRKPKCRPTNKSCVMSDRMCKRWEQYRALKTTDSEHEHSSNNDNDDNAQCTMHNAQSNNDNAQCNDNSISTEARNVCQSKTVSAEKLEMLPSTSRTENISDRSSYVFMNNDMWLSLLSNTKCDECDMNSLDVITKGTYGFSTKIELVCKNCDKIFNSVFTSPRETLSKCFEANKKLVEAFLKIGKGHAALEVFSMAIGINAMDKKTFSKCLNMLHEEKSTFKNDILEMSRNIVRKKHQDLDENAGKSIMDIAVSYDGTWHKRGYTSLYGIGIVVDVLTGLAIDFEILSKYCPACTTAKRDLDADSAEFVIWFEGHKSECDINFIGSSNSMEMKAAEIMWKRSVNICGMRYVSILSDGDAKTYNHLLTLNIYGNGIKITKEECINHVAKRLGTGLRNKVIEWRSKGITIGGRKEGSLKESTILKLTNYYRKAIKDNVPDVQMMKSAIFASLFHCSSTNAIPRHNKCPTGSTSWCFYQRALANNEKPESHVSMKTKLSEDIVAKILPVYQRLASNDLLARCVSGKTQNTNESLHSVIWKNCSKDTFVSKKRLEMSVISSISEFNFGCFNSLSTEQEDINLFSMSIAQRRDKRRINQSEQRNSREWKRKRVSKKNAKTLKTKLTLDKEGETYSAGRF